MVFSRIKFKSSELGKEKKKKIGLVDWWKEDMYIELDDFEHNYFINRELRRVRG